jgi:hypothetical protein
MFGYRLIKIEEIEVLNNKLEDAIKLINEQKDKILELNNKNKEYENIIANLTKPKNVKNEKVKNENKDEKPVKKVRRKYTKKNTKKED